MSEIGGRPAHFAIIEGQTFMSLDDLLLGLEEIAVHREMEHNETFEAEVIRGIARGLADSFMDQVELEVDE